MFRKDFLDTSEFDICSTLESKMGLEIKLILADIAIFFLYCFIATSKKHLLDRRYVYAYL